MPKATERAMLGCFPVVARRPSLSSYEEGSTSTSAASMSVSTASPPTTSSSTASTSSPAFLDDDDADALYPDDAAAAAAAAAEPSEPDAGGLSTAIAAGRFFLATPGLSNSIVDSSVVVDHRAPSPEAAAASHAGRDSTVSNVRALRCAATSAFPAAPASCSSASASSSSATKKATPPSQHDGGNGMGPAVRKVSVCTDAPRADFLKSMVEMVEALGLDPRRRDADLARLHDLLLCYIALNERDALRDILGAFADLMCLLDVTTTTTAAAVVDNAAGEKRSAAAAGEQADADRRRR